MTALFCKLLDEINDYLNIRMDKIPIFHKRYTRKLPKTLKKC